MAGYTYNVVTHIDFLGVYKCSNCGNNQIFNHKVKTHHSYSHPGRKSNEIKNQTERDAKLLFNQEVQSVLNCIDNKTFTKTNFKCKCEKCFYKEPWQKIKNIFWSELFSYRFMPFVLMYFVLVVSAIIGVLFYGDFLVFCIALPITIVALIIHIACNLNNNKQKTLLLNKPSTSLPKLFFDKSELYQFMVDHNSEYNFSQDTIRKFTPSSTLLDDAENYFCNICGALLTKTQDKCHVCGEIAKSDN